MSECPTCGDTFRNVNGMKAHHKQIHGESIAGVTITCAYCGEKAEKRQRKGRNDHEFCLSSAVGRHSTTPGGAIR